MPQESNEILSPSALQHIKDYELLANTVIDGYFSGIHRSSSQGSGMEFIHYRNYMQGDDLKNVDWKAAARTDKFFTKIFEEETNMDCHIVLDSSNSMFYESPQKDEAVEKFHYSKMLAACITWLVHKQNDRIGFSAISDKIYCHVDPTSKKDYVQQLLAELSLLKHNGSFSTKFLSNFFSEHLKNRGVFILISDFLNDEVNTIKFLRGLKENNYDCVAIQVLHPDELNLPFKGSIDFIDSESNSRIVTTPENILSNYTGLINAFQENLKNICLMNEIDLIQVNTSQSLHLPIDQLMKRTLAHL